MAKKKKRAPARRSKGPTKAAAYKMAAASFAAARYGGRVLEMLPHGFDSFEKGKGKSQWSNRRVQIGVVATLALAASNKYRPYAALAAFLTGLAVQQHSISYIDLEDEKDGNIEVREWVDVPDDADQQQLQREAFSAAVTAAWEAAVKK